MGRRGADGYRVLPDYPFAISFWRRATMRCGNVGTRPRIRNGPAGVGSITVFKRPGNFHMWNADEFLSAGAIAGNDGQNRSRSAFQCARRPAEEIVLCTGK